MSLPRGAVAAVVDAEVTGVEPLSGGDIHDAYEVNLSDGRVVFVKTSAGADREMFVTERRGLEWLGEAGALRVPEVIAVSGEEAEQPFLVLEMLTPAKRRASGFDDQLGEGLAALHRFGAPSFGLDHDNFIGRLPQDNGPADTWPDFYRSRRLEPMVRRAFDARLVGRDVLRAFDRLFTALEERVGPNEPPARLHGDLWGGNLHADDGGAPCLIDPAAYGGSREVDLAMMRLFGGFGQGVFDSYMRAWPLEPEWNDRVPLYQLYPLLVHVNLFGASYVDQVSRALRAVL